MANVTDTAPFVNSPRVSRTVAYNKRDLILYALGIGSRDPRYIYELHKDFAPFPTYPIVLAFKGDSFDTVTFPSPCMRDFPSPPMQGVKVGLDAEKLIEKVAELPKDGATLKLVGGTVGIHKKGSGALMERLFELVDDAGKVYYKIVDAGFMVGAKNFTDSGKTYSKSIKMPLEPPTRTLETPTDEHITSLYRLSGDYNPLHVDHEFAKASGFERPIIHGQCTMGHVTRALLDSLASGDQRRFRSVQLRFASPVLPGQTLVTEVWAASPDSFVFQSKVKETGKICVSNGTFKLNPAGKL